MFLSNLRKDKREEQRVQKSAGNANRVRGKTE